MSRVFIWFFVALLALTAPRAALADAPRCRGNNLLDELRAQEPTVYSAVRERADATPNARHVLWKVEHPRQPDRPASYLFGTIHLADPRVLALTPATQSALSGVRRIALEVDDLSPERVGSALASIGDLVTLPGQGQLKTLLSDSDARKAHGALLQAGLPEDFAGRVRPWLAQIMLATTACERARVASGLLPLDAALQKKAERAGVSVIGLETIEMQFRSLAAVPQSDQVTLLRTALKMHDRADDMMETLVQAYLQRDLGVIWPLQLALARRHGMEVAAFAAFERHLLTDRNTRMRDRALGHLNYGGVFMAVGALHLPGEKGLVALLRDAGYSVTPIE